MSNFKRSLFMKELGLYYHSNKLIPTDIVFTSITNNNWREPSFTVTHYD